MVLLILTNMAPISHGNKVTFATLERRLRRRVLERIHNGDFSERGAALLAGISQPHLHNALKGSRRLSPELADRLMVRLSIDFDELLEPGETGDHRDPATSR